MWAITVQRTGTLVKLASGAPRDGQGQRAKRKAACGAAVLSRIGARRGLEMFRIVAGAHRHPRDESGTGAHHVIYTPPPGG